MNKEQIKFVESILKSKEVKIQGVKIDLTEEQLQKLQQLVVPKYNNPFERVDKGEKYYSIGVFSEEFVVFENTEKHIETDIERFKSGNYYNNKGFAEQVAMDMNLQQRLRKFTYENGWSDDLWGQIENKYSVVFDVGSKVWTVQSNVYSHFLFAIYFKDIGVAIRAIEEVVRPFCKENPNYRFQEE